MTRECLRPTAVAFDFIPYRLRPDLHRLERHVVGAGISERCPDIVELVVAVG